MDVIIGLGALYLVYRLAVWIWDETLWQARRAAFRVKSRLRSPFRTRRLYHYRLGKGFVPKSKLLKAVDSGDIAKAKRAFRFRRDKISQPIELDLTPLSVAMNNGDLEMFRFLAEQGADLFVPLGNDRRTLLNTAIGKGKNPIAKEIVRLGFPVDKFSEDDPPLFQALKLENFEMAEFLLLNGANPNFETGGGTNPLQFCFVPMIKDANRLRRSSLHFRVLVLMLKNGAKVEKSDLEDIEVNLLRSIFFYAASLSGRFDVADRCRQSGCNIDFALPE